MKRFAVLSIILLSISPFYAQQDSLPYSNISVTPTTYSSGNIVSRMIDGLGYRFYWASKGLTEKDLNFRITEESRNTEETIEHIYDLSVTLNNVANNRPNLRPSKKQELSYEELRKKTLLNLKEASEKFKDRTEKEIAEIKIVFQRGDQKSEFPFWNYLNGPLSDAIYHTGQIVTYRRASGNPMNPNVKLFIGKSAE